MAKPKRRRTRAGTPKSKQEAMKKDLVYKLVLQGYPRAAILKMVGISPAHFDRCARELREESPEFREAFYRGKDRVAGASAEVLREAYRANIMFNGLMAGKSIKEVAREVEMQPIKAVKYAERLVKSVRREKAEIIQKAVDAYYEELARFREKMPSKKTLDRIFVKAEIWAERAPIEAIKKRLKALERRISETKNAGERNRLVMERNALRAALNRKLREEPEPK
jgi:hypothetical protein